MNARADGLGEPLVVPRGRGRPPRIDRQRIIDAATELGLEVGLEEISMTTVADRLGVKRSALNYHVSDLDELVELVATNVLEFAMDPSWVPAADAPWQDWVRSYASDVRRMLLGRTPMALYFRFPPGAALGALEPTDLLYGRLFDAGFDDAGVSMATTYIAQMVFMSVRDQLLAGKTGQHPQDVELGRALDSAPEGELLSLRRFLAAGGRAEPDAQFAFDLDCVIAGLEAHLAKHSRRANRAAQRRSPRRPRGTRPS